VRIGHGFDVHRFGEKSEVPVHIKLGGVSIVSDRPVLAHSDGDVAIHSVCDALLGACALGDIGEHFPDTDAQYENIDSQILLREVMQKVKSSGYKVANIDVTLVAQQPRLGPFKKAMVSNLAQLMECLPGQVNVKATTTEGLGYIGLNEGIACYAAILLEEV